MRFYALSLFVFVACDQPGDRAGQPTNTSPTSDATQPSGDAFVPGPEAEAVCAEYRTIRALPRATWTGSTETCDAGDVVEPGRTDALAAVNFHRKLAGLPAVTLDAAKNESAQHCALMMQANRNIVHDPPASWRCYDTLGAGAAGQSNLATLEAVKGVDLYMSDEGVDTLGHRRWILSNTLGPIGVGSTSQYSCLHVIGGSGRAGKRWVAWPSPGYVPFATGTVDWSIQSDELDLGDAEITVTRDGQVMPVVVRELAPYYGSTYGLGITPDGWFTKPGETYDVAVRGLLEDIDYRVTFLACD